MKHIVSDIDKFDLTIAKAKSIICLLIENGEDVTIGFRTRHEEICNAIFSLEGFFDDLKDLILFDKTDDDKEISVGKED